MRLIPNVIRTVLVCAMLVSAHLSAEEPVSWPTAWQAEVDKVYEAYKQRDYSSAFAQAKSFRDVHKSDLNTTQRHAIESMMIILAHFAAQSDAKARGTGDLSQKSLLRFQELRSPTDPADEAYCLFGEVQLMWALHYAARGDTASARKYLLEGRYYLANNKSSMKSTFTPQRLSELESLIGGGRRPSIGDYVTNRGPMQSWIGKIVRVNGSEVTVKVTYSSNDSEKGQTKVYSDNEILPLTGLSVGAVISGWW